MMCILIPALSPHDTRLYQTKNRFSIINVQLYHHTEMDESYSVWVRTSTG